MVQWRDGLEKDLAKCSFIVDFKEVERVSSISDEVVRIVWVPISASSNNTELHGAGGEE